MCIIRDRFQVLIVADLKPKDVENSYREEADLLESTKRVG